MFKFPEILERKSLNVDLQSIVPITCNGIMQRGYPSYFVVSSETLTMGLIDHNVTKLVKYGKCLGKD